MPDKQRINVQTEEINQLFLFFREKSDLSEAVEALHCERQAIDEYRQKQSQVCQLICGSVMDLVAQDTQLRSDK